VFSKRISEFFILKTAAVFYWNFLEKRKFQLKGDKLFFSEKNQIFDNFSYFGESEVFVG